MSAMSIFTMSSTSIDDEWETFLLGQRTTPDVEVDFVAQPPQKHSNCFGYDDSKKIDPTPDPNIDAVSIIEPVPKAIPKNLVADEDIPLSLIHI